ncbi:MAG: PLDc N-terminal domain-containing protein [Candidatus Aenigmarchaeota archaeon]|nr:PLDc N-terminal domain-containing protein [Candidatus Aenigmarchaeota archaeon]
MSWINDTIANIGIYLFMATVIILVLAFGFWIWSIIDCLKSKRKSKWFWLIAILLLFFAGSLLYLLLEKRKFSKK